MSTKQEVERRTTAATELGAHCPDLDAAGIVDSLSGGLTHLRDLLVKRVHEDVERQFLIDSLMAPSSQSEDQAQVRTTKLETEIYSIIVADDEVTQGGYVGRPGEWFRDWLLHLRLGGEHDALFQQRVEFYRSDTAEERRLKFLTALQQAMPMSTRTPLVLFRMFPRAIRIVAAVAFGDLARAQELRAEQSSFLPAVSDCLECHGRLLDNDESCRVCGNPVWEFEWLQSD